MDSISHSFVIHPQLAKDSVWVGDLLGCEVRLHRNAAYVWLILVPKCDNSQLELIDLRPEESLNVFRAIKTLSCLLKDLFQPDKLNIGILGNIVPQLHVHVLARYTNDPAWPGPVWGHPGYETYQEDALEARKEQIAAYLQKFV